MKEFVVFVVALAIVMSHPCHFAVTPNNSSDPPRLLNYLTAPHVLVWSAAVASSSLPGVFEANRLMVKDADGTVRYESAERAAFSDGSMEQGKRSRGS